MSARLWHREGGGFSNTMSHRAKITGKTRPYKIVNCASSILPDWILARETGFLGKIVGDIPRNPVSDF